MFNPAFAPSHLDTFIPAIVEESMVFVEKLRKVAGTEEVVKMNDLTIVNFLMFHCLVSRCCLKSCFVFPPCRVRDFGFFVCAGFREGVDCSI